MKTLADVKRAITPGVILAGKIYKYTTAGADTAPVLAGVVDLDPAPVVLVNSQGFAIDRNGRQSWYYFGPAKEYTIHGDTFTQHIQRNGAVIPYMQYTINPGA